MADLELHRDHALGLVRARKVALKWARHIEDKLEMACTLIEGDDEDVLEFRRPGVEGRMVVAATRFDVEATLGFMFRPFLGMVEAEAARQLDAAIAKGASEGDDQASGRQAASTDREAAG